MIIYKGKELRTLEEQVLYLTEVYENIIKVNKTLSNFGINVLGVKSSPSDLPGAGESNGDAYLVGAAQPYELYVWTNNIEWINIGYFPLQGPEGPQGNPGIGISAGQGSPPDATAPTGTLYIDTVTGLLYKYYNDEWRMVGSLKGQKGDRGIQGPIGPVGIGLPGPRGPQGLPGPQGPRGDRGAPGETWRLVGIVSSIGGLPGNASAGDGYLVGSSGSYDLYVYVENLWVNQGPLTIGPGAIGPIGPVGPQGPEGPQGDTGPQGPEGPQGPIGPAGVVDLETVRNALDLILPYEENLFTILARASGKFGGGFDTYPASAFPVAGRDSVMLRTASGISYCATLPGSQEYTSIINKQFFAKCMNPFLIALNQILQSMGKELPFTNIFNYYT